MINENKQGDYALRRTGNYTDLIQGNGWHSTPITFNEFLSKPESMFIYEPEFMQVPDYIHRRLEILDIEEQARQFVVDYIVDEFEELLLGSQNYVAWARRFKNRCNNLSAAFWAQVNMTSLMTAKELEYDDNSITRTNTGGVKRNATGQTTTTGDSTTNSTINQTVTQDITNQQTTDATSREATVTTLPTDGQLTSEVEFDWTQSADNAHEVRSRAGDSNQHMETQTNGTNNSNTTSNSVTEQNSSNAGEQSTQTGKENMLMTNKMFMYEREKGIQNAAMLQPLEWLRANLRPMFYMIY